MRAFARCAMTFPLNRVGAHCKRQITRAAVGNCHSSRQLSQHNVAITEMLTVSRSTVVRQETQRNSWQRQQPPSTAHTPKCTGTYSRP